MSKPRERLHGSLGGDSEGLPGGWTRAKLPDVALINMGQSPPGKSYNSVGAGPPFFQGKADFGERYPSVRVWCSDPRKVAHAGDVLLSVRAPVGPTNIADRTCAIGRGLAAITPKSGTTSEYIFFALRRLEQKLALWGTGSTFAAISKRDIEEIQIYLPPLNEQKRIVAKLEELLPKVNAVRERLIRVKEIMKRFRQSVLSAACSGRLTEDWRDRRALPGDSKWNKNYGVANGLEYDEATLLPASWARAMVNQVCNEIVDCPHSTPKWAKGGEICIRTTNFRPGVLDLSEVRYVSKETFKKRTERLEPMPGDVIYSREGGILGIACMIPEEAKVCLGQRMMLMRTDNTRFLSAFLMHVLNSPEVQKVVAELTGGSASPHLNVGDIKNFLVPVPPTTEQKEIVRRIESLFTMADKIEKRVEVELSRTEKMTQAILAKAFRGELVPTEAELALQEGHV